MKSQANAQRGECNKTRAGHKREIESCADNDTWGRPLDLEERRCVDEVTMLPYLGQGCESSFLNGT